MNPRGISTALYGWMERYRRDGVGWDWRRIYGDCAEAGVDAVETDPLPDKLAILQDLGLTVSSSYIGMELWRPLRPREIDEHVMPVAERLAAASGTTLVLNADLPIAPPPESALDPRVQGANLSAIADAVAPLGVNVALHNHADNRSAAQRDLDSVVRWADSSVGLCIDTGWAVASGHDPVQWISQHAARVRALHLRTVAADGLPGEDLTTGTPAVGPLLDAMPGFDGWLILELWHPEPMQPRRSMIEAVRRSALLLRSIIEE
jgi:inosose dehydratase